MRVKKSKRYSPNWEDNYIAMLKGEMNLPNNVLIGIECNHGHSVDGESIRYINKKSKIIGACVVCASKRHSSRSKKSNKKLVIDKHRYKDLLILNEALTVKRSY